MTLTVKVFDDEGTCVSAHEARDLTYDGAGEATTMALWRAFAAEYDLTRGRTPVLTSFAARDGTITQPTEYTVSILPSDFGDVMPDNRYHWELKVEYRGRDLWAVKNGPFCLGKDGNWDYEMRPSEREEEWLAEHRFDLGTALDLAREHAPDVTVNGHTAREELAKYRERKKGERHE